MGKHSEIDRMRKLLNTLYIVQPEGYLSIDANNIVVLVKGKEIFRIPGTNLEMILCFNYLGASSKLMYYCIENNIHLSFLTPTGRFLASVEGSFRGNVLLRKKQCLMSEDDEFCLNVAQRFVFAKIMNSRYEINRSIRERKENSDVNRLLYVSNELKEGARNVLCVSNEDRLRGIEGDMAKLYFSSFNDMIIPNDTVFAFESRSRRPPTDPINVMLSFGYSLLSREVASAISSIGMDPYIGYLHRDRPGRESFALDLMEELRPIFVDRFVISLINLRQFSKDDFINKETGEVIFKEESKKKYLKNWQEKKKQEVFHPILQEKVCQGLIPFVQATIFSRYLRNEIESYAPYIKR